MKSPSASSATPLSGASCNSDSLLCRFELLPEP
jgi:hypothetical protein